YGIQSPLAISRTFLPNPLPSPFPQSLLRLLCSGASELPRKVESLAAAGLLFCFCCVHSPSLFSLCLHFLPPPPTPLPQSLLRLLCSGASELPRKVESLAVPLVPTPPSSSICPSLQQPACCSTCAHSPFFFHLPLSTPHSPLPPPPPPLSPLPQSLLRLLSQPAGLLVVPSPPSSPICPSPLPTPPSPLPPLPQSLLRLLCSGASELPRKVESLAAAASMLADGGGEGGGADTGTGGAAGGAGGGGGVRVEEWSMERMRGVVATQAEAVGRLAQLVERDVRDVGIMMGGGGMDPLGGVAGA
ncbi:unnamed protein product, partial [Closterium sp. NIES-54]